MADVNISKFRATVNRAGSSPASPGFVVSEGQNPVQPSGTTEDHLPVTIAPVSTGLAITESQILSGAGTVAQYIRGDGSLADFPESSGGGSSVSYYLNGSVNQGTIGGVAYKELNKVPILGAGTDFTINADGYIASFITDAGDPNLLEIPGGNWNFETYFSASSGGGSPTFYVELYKYNGTTFTLIASSVSSPELIAFGTNLTPYFSTLAVPTTTLALTDRLAVRYYVTHSGRTITMHTENNHLCQIITTFTTGLTALNGLTAQVQNFAVGTTGTDFNIASAVATHTFNLPTASGSVRGALSSSDWTIFNNKQNALTNPITGTGTTNYIPKFTGATTLGNSNIQDSGSLVSVGVATNFGADITLTAANPFVYGGTSVGSLGLSNIGGQTYIRLFGASHSTTPNVTQFVNGSSTSLTIAASGAATFSSSINALKGDFGTPFTSTNVLQAIAPSATNSDMFQVGMVGVTNGFTIKRVSSNFNYAFVDGNVGIRTATPTSALQVLGSVAFAHTTKSANYTLDATDYTVGFDCASNRTATLPDATTCAGRVYVIYQFNTGSGTRSVTLDGNGSQTINGVTTYSLSPYCNYSAVTIQSDGSNWIIIGSNLTVDCL